MESVFCGGDIHKKILLYFPPYEWCRVFSRVCRVWRHVANSDALWNTISNRLITEVPWLKDVQSEALPSNYKGRGWCHYVCINRERFHDSLFYILQIAQLHIPRDFDRALTIRDIKLYGSFTWQVKYELHTTATTATIYLMIDTPQLRNAFFDVVRKLITHGRIKDDKCLLWRNKTIISTRIKEIAIRRKKRKIIE